MAATVAASAEFVCVADNESVDVYATSTLKLLYRCIPTGSFVVHTFIRGHSMHVVDAAGSYASVDLRSNSIRSAPRSLTATLRPSAEGDDSTVKVLGTKRQTAAQRAVVSATSAAVAKAGHFTVYHTADDGTPAGSELWIALLLTTGEIQVHPARRGSSSAAAVVGNVPFAGDVIFAVGAETGVICCAVKNDPMLRILVPASPGVYPSMSTYDARVDISAVGVHPTGFAVALGGRRGEVHVLQDVTDTPITAGFSDHWHHTSVSAVVFTNGGSTLLSSAAEGTVCLWSLADFSMIKTRTRLETVHGLIPAVDRPSLVVIPGGIGSVALLDLVERRIVRQRDGVHWSSSHPCRGIVVTDWFGTKAVILTGLPDVVRIYDPITQDSLHTHVVCPAMETVAKPPTVGVTSVASLKQGKLLVTFEDANDAALPSALRWWRWNGKDKSYTEEQCVYSPHGQEPLLAIVPLSDRSLITVSATAAKCWAPLSMMSDDGVNGMAITAAVSDIRRLKMHCISSIRSTAGRSFTAACVSPDASVVFLALEDVVQAYDVSSACVSARTWPLAVELSQLFTDAPFRSIHYAADAIVAATSDKVVLLPFESVPRLLITNADRVDAVCTAADADTIAIVATTKGKSVLTVHDKATLAVTRTAVLTADDIVAVAAFGRDDNFITVSRSCGLKVVSARAGAAADAAVAAAEKPAAVNQVTAPAAVVVQPTTKGLAAFFRRATAPDDQAASTTQTVAARQRLIAAREYLHLAVGQGEAYAAPATSQVLEGFLNALLCQPRTDEINGS